MGAAGPMSMGCCTRAVLVQSSSRAAKISTKSLNRCCSCSCCGVLRCSPLRRPNSSIAITVSGDREADVVMAGMCWSELQYSPRAPPESLQLLCGGWGLELVSTDVWAEAARRLPLHGGSGPTGVARSCYRGRGRPLACRHVLPSGPTSPSQQCTHL